MDKKQELLNQVAKLNEEAIQQMNTRIGKINVELGIANNQVNLLSSEKYIIEKNIKKLKDEISLFSKSIVITTDKKVVDISKKSSGLLDKLCAKKPIENPFATLYFNAANEFFRTKRPYHRKNEVYFRNFLVNNEYTTFEGFCVRINTALSMGNEGYRKVDNEMFIVREDIKRMIREYQRYSFSNNPLTSTGYNSRWCVKKARKALLFLINKIDTVMIPAIKKEQYRIK